MLRCRRLVTMVGITVMGWPAVSAAQSVSNPSFEQDGTGVAGPAGWTSKGSVNADFTEFGGSTGDFRLTHWSAEAFSVATSTTVTGLRDGWYTLRGRVRRSAGENDSYLELSCDHGQRERVYLPVAWPDQWLEVTASSYVRKGRCTITLHTQGAAGEWSNFDDIRLVPGAHYLPVRGVDVSSLNKSEDLGGRYFDAKGAPPIGKHPKAFERSLHAHGHGHGHAHGSAFWSWFGPTPHHKHAKHHWPGSGKQTSSSALKILKDSGVSHARFRVWVDPADGYHDVDAVVEMARRAHQTGLDVLVDLHFSDTWADPAHQAKPVAWEGYSVLELEKAVYDHTYEVCSRIKRRSGRAPDMVQIGNELNAGMLWPDGHTWDPPNWENLAGFLSAGYAAVKACSPSTKVMLHLADGGDNGLYQWWFDNITALGVSFDVIGVSYYGYWHGSLGDLQWNLNDISARYDKDVIVVETAYPSTLEDEDGWPNIVGLPEQLVPGYPATPEGQYRNFRDVMSIVRAVPGGRGLGAFYWDATWTAVPGNGWDPTDPSSGNAWENQALFDFDDRALPAMDVFGEVDFDKCWR